MEAYTSTPCLLTDSLTHSSVRIMLLYPIWRLSRVPGLFIVYSQLNTLKLYNFCLVENAIKKITFFAASLTWQMNWLNVHKKMFSYRTHGTKQHLV